MEKGKLSFSRWIPPAAAVLAAVCLLRFPGDVSEAAADGMTLALRRLVPLLFPYSVLSALVVRRGWLPPGRTVSRPFRLPRAAGGALVTGLFAGFPVGAGGAAELYKTGKLSRSDAERLTAVSSVPSPAFLAGAVGGMWGDACFGWFLWILGVLSLLLFSRLSAARPSVGADLSSVPEPQRRVPFSADFSRAVSEAASSCLTVTAFVTFFRILAVVSAKLLPSAGPFLTLILELSAAARYAASVGGIAGAAVTGAGVGFGSLSVFMQIAAKTAETDLSLQPYLSSRFLLAAVLAAGGALYASAFPMVPASPAFSETTLSPGSLFAVTAALSGTALLFRDSRE
jgi:hypothetical protein